MSISCATSHFKAHPGKAGNFANKGDWRCVLALLRAMVYAKSEPAFVKSEREFIEYVYKHGDHASEQYHSTYVKQHKERWATYSRIRRQCWGHVDRIDTNNLYESFKGRNKQEFGLRRNKHVTKLALQLVRFTQSLWKGYAYANASQSNPHRTWYVEGNTRSPWTFAKSLARMSLCELHS